MTTIDTLTLAWTALSTDAQHNEWRSFLDALDAGAAGEHRFYALLLPMWDAAELPDVINDERLERYGQEMLEDEVVDAWFDHCVRAQDPSCPEFWARFDPEFADHVILGCPLD